MARGYCSDCGQLVEIVAGEPHGPSRTSRKWFAVPHRNADGAACAPTKEAGDIEFGIPLRVTYGRKAN